MPHSRRTGRPPRVSRAMLQEAALELFLEQGYAATTVDEIARRAGVSRATFFNHFAAKGDVLWFEIDDAGSRLEAALREASDPDPWEAVRRALLVVAEPFGADAVPFVLTQHELIGSAGEVQASALLRLTQHAATLERDLARRGLSRSRARLAAYTLVAAVIAAARDWADAGPGRGELAEYLGEALSAVLPTLRAA